MRSLAKVSVVAIVGFVVVAAWPVGVIAQPAIRADGAVESTSGGFVFPDGSVQTTAAGQYDKVNIVAKSGAPFTTIQDAINSATGPPGSRFLVSVGPGLYNERVTMKAGVDIQGSGALTTRITFGGSPSDDTGTVVGATDAELRHLSVESIAAAGLNAIAIYNNEASPRLTHVQAVALGGASAYGIYNRNSSPPTNYVFASAAFATLNNYGTYNITTDLAKASSPAMHRVVIFMGTILPVGTDDYWGIYNTGGSAPSIDNTEITVFGGTNAYGVYNVGSAPSIDNTDITLFGGTSAYGVYNDVGSPAIMQGVTIKVSDATTQNTGVFSGNNSTTVLRNCHVQGLKGGQSASTAYGLENSMSRPEVHHSILAGDTHPIFGSDPKVAYSQLSGGTKAVFAAGSCLGAYDENFFALGNQCF